LKKMDLQSLKPEIVLAAENSKTMESGQTPLQKDF